MVAYGSAVSGLEGTFPENGRELVLTFHKEGVLALTGILKFRPSLLYLTHSQATSTDR